MPLCPLPLYLSTKHRGAHIDFVLSLKSLALFLSSAMVIATADLRNTNSSLRCRCAMAMLRCPYSLLRGQISMPTPTTPENTLLGVGGFKKRGGIKFLPRGPSKYIPTSVSLMSQEHPAKKNYILRLFFLSKNWKIGEVTFLQIKLCISGGCIGAIEVVFSGCLIPSLISKSLLQGESKHPERPCKLLLDPKITSR